MAEIPQQFLLSVIGNIVPVLIVATLSLTALRQILAAHRHAELVELQETISTGLADELRARDRPGLSEIKSDLSRELRDTLVDDDFIHRLTKSADVRRPLLDDARVAIVGDIIHMMSVALIFPQSPHSVFMRTFCHIADRTNQSLPPNHIKRYSPRLRAKILPELCVF